MVKDEAPRGQGSDIEKWREFYNSEKGSFEKISENLLNE